MFFNVLLIAVAGVAWWAFVLSLVGALSGWGALARHYRTRGAFDGTRFYLASARIGWSNYGGVLNVGVNAHGLRLSVIFPFRPGHPPLLIPWADVTAEPVKGWVFGYFDLRFRLAPTVHMRIGHQLGTKIAAAANRSWASDDPPITP